MLSPTRQYWGPWPTLGFYALFVFVFLTVGGIALFAAVLGATFFIAESEPERLVTYMRDGGTLWSLWIVAIAECAVVYGLIKFRQGETVRRYLAFHRIPARTLITWLGLATLLIAVSDLTQLALGRPIVPSVMVEQYLYAPNLPLLWSVAIVAAPLWEEIVFRGFLLTGFLNSRLGTTGSVLLTAVLFAMLHGQYDLYGVASVFTTGLLLGMARIRTGSVVTCIAMHAFGNLIATLETAVVVSRTSP